VHEVVDCFMNNNLSIQTGCPLGAIYVLSNVDTILTELDEHQTTLQLLCTERSAAIDSFLDDVSKWQIVLREVEIILRQWADVQEKWIELEEV